MRFKAAQSKPEESIMKSQPTRSILTLLAIIILAVCVGLPWRNLAASDPGSGDWPMWGGTPDRNMVSNMKGLPTSWGPQDEEERQMDGHARLAILRQCGGGRRTGLRRHQQRRHERSEAGRRSRRLDGLSANPTANFYGSTRMKNSLPGASTIGRIKASALRRWSKATSFIT